MEEEEEVILRQLELQTQELEEVVLTEEVEEEEERVLLSQHMFNVREALEASQVMR